MKLTGSLLHEHQRISQARLAKHGTMPERADEWWAQIQGIAASLQIETRWADWQERPEGEKV